MDFRPSHHASRLSPVTSLFALIAFAACLAPALQGQAAHFSGAVPIGAREPLNASRNISAADVGSVATNAIQSTSGQFGSVDVGASSANPIAMVFTFDAAVTVGSTAVFTQGATGLDFTDAGGGTCKAGTAYNANDTCTINVTFNPRAPGSRYGAAELLDASGNLLAMGYVQGTGVGPQVTFANSTSGDSLPEKQITLGSGFYWPIGVTVDAAGNVFVADTHNFAVKEIVAVNGSIPNSPTIKALGGYFLFPWSVAVDGAGNIFVGNDTGYSGAVYEIVAAGGYTNVKTLQSGLAGAAHVALDGRGNVFVAEYANPGAVKEIVAAGGYTTVKTLISGLKYPCGIAVDATSNIFFADRSLAVKEALAADGYSTIKTVHGGFRSPCGLRVDASGNVFVGDNASNAIYEILAAGGYTTVVTLVDGGINADDVALDGSGNVFIADYNNSRVVELDYADPPSLTFPNTNIGSQSRQLVTVSNNGNAPLTFPIPSAGSNPALTGTFKFDSSTTCPRVNSTNANPGAVSKGTSCTYALDFNPAAVGASSGSLTLTDNNLYAAGPGYATQSIALSGQGEDLPFGKLGNAVDSVTFSNTVGKGDSLELTGWAADPVDGAPLGNVQATMDGTSVGTPTLGIGRPDIANLYHNNSYYFSGFRLLYPASSLALGTHSVSVIATNSAGESTTLGTRAFTVADTAGAGSPFGFLSQPVDSVTFSTTVGQANSVEANGWLADPQDGAPLSNVKAYIDGTLIGTPALGLARPAVAATYNNNAYLNSGFALLYPAASLSLGAHQLTVVAIDSGGRSKTLGPQTFTVAATAGLGSPFGVIGTAVDSVTGTNPVSQSGSLLVRGWVADPQDGAPLSNVKVYVDGILMGKPTLGLKRADIAALYGNAYLNSGFQLTHSASSFAAGKHLVTVTAIDSGGRSTTLGPLAFTVQ